MELLLLLALASFGAVTSGVGLARGGRAAQRGAILGGLSLAGVVLVAFFLDAPRVGSGTIPPGVGVLDGRLIPNDYMRLVIALWALDAGLIVFVAWLAGGLAGLRGLLPALHASIVGAAVAFSATDLTLGAAAAGATGLVALIVLLAWRDQAGIHTAARELRVSMLGTVLLLAGIAVAPLAAGLALHAATAGSLPAAIPESTSGANPATPLVGILVLAVAGAVALRAGSLPFHLRVPRLADVAPPTAMPLLLVWLPLPLAVVGLAAVDLLLAPLALPLGTERLIIVAVAIVTLVGAGVAAFLGDDLRHTIGYLVIADGGLVLLGFAALTPDAWGPARTWLVAIAASKTALAGWAAVVEGRFGTRTIPDLRGWGRHAPLLATALLVTTLANFGLPGWAAFTARVDLAALTAAAPLDVILVALGFLTLPTYLRLLAVGTGSPTSRVERAAPERIVRTRRFERLPVEQERSDDEEAGAVAAASRSAASGQAGLALGPGRRLGVRSPLARPPRPRAGTARRGRRLMTALRRDATELTAAAVLTLAVLAALTSWGVLDIRGAASEPAPITTGPGSD